MKGFERAILLLIIVGFCVRNLPWHLDDYDQAKQAYASFEMVETGQWFYQHTPAQRIATKPPFAGWISAGIHALTGWWDGAWRLPSLAASAAILVMLFRAGNRLMAGGGLLAAVAFGLNLFAPRLATLARTDMLLSFFGFLVGYTLYQKISTGTPWTPRERWVIFLSLLVSMMTKGPIAYAFLLPGLVAFAVCCRRLKLRCGAWSGAWSWFLPLLFFVAWAWYGLSTSPEFYEQVVKKEFLGRFTIGEKAVHGNQPVYFYLLHLLHKFAPWSVLLLALAWVKRVRAFLVRDPATLWLVCWALGGLVLMSLVPSKRPDRIFPVIPPLCLLLPALLAQSGWDARRVIRNAVGFALLFSGGYTVFNVVQGYRTAQGTLVEFGNEVRQLAAARGWNFRVISGKDEGMLLYLRQTKFIKPGDAEEAWERGELQALVLSEKQLQKSAGDLGKHTVLLRSEEAPEKNSRYVFIVRPELVEKHP